VIVRTVRELFLLSPQDLVREVALKGLAQNPFLDAACSDHLVDRVEICDVIIPVTLCDGDGSKQSMHGPLYGMPAHHHQSLIIPMA